MMGNKEIPKIPAPKEIEDWKTILIVKQITKLREKRQSFTQTRVGNTGIPNTGGI